MEPVVEKIKFEELRKEIKLKSHGDLMNSIHVLLNVPSSGIDCYNIKETYRRLRIETAPTVQYLFLQISNELNEFLKRKFVAQYIYDPFVPAFKSELEGSFRAQINSNIIHIPLMLLPSDEIFISLYARKPFEASMKLDF
jgi:hypothetical protein